MTHVRAHVRSMVRPMVRGVIGSPYGGSTYHDGISYSAETGRVVIKAVGAAPTITTLTSAFTFTGGNQSMYMGPAGLLVQSVTNTPRIEYDASGNCLGLLMEASRTNLMTYSQDLSGADWSSLGSTLSSNSATAPDGTTTADLVTEDGGSSAHGYVNNRTLATSTVYTTSFWAKPNGRTFAIMRYTGTGWLNSDQAAFFNLTGSGSLGTRGTGVTATITAYPNGWYRCTSTYTTAASSGTGSGSRLAFSSADTTQIYAGNSSSGMYFWGVQQEAGQFASSYIPTTTTSVARTADSCIRTLGSEFSATAGTVIVQGRQPGGNSTSRQPVFSFDDGTANNRIPFVRPGSSSLLQLRIDTGGVNQSANGDTVTNSAVFKAAGAWQSNDIAFVLNAGVIQTDAAATIPTVTTLGLGYESGSVLQMNGHIRAFDYYPVRLPNAFLQLASA